MQTVKELRAAGFKVRVIHKRRANDNGVIVFGNKRVLKPETVLHTGGNTTVEITAPNGATTSGHAECSLKDSFCRKTGLSVALGRALKQLQVS